MEDTKSCNAIFAPREMGGAPSTARTASLKSAYLGSPLHVDIEYLRFLTESHQSTLGMEAIERRAENHAYALERLTPVIHPGERIAAHKTRFLRGAIPYANYAAGPFLSEVRKQEQDPQQRFAEQGSGGGIARAREEAAQDGQVVFSGKFLISHEDLSAFADLCAYWEDKCFMAAGERLWKNNFPGAQFVEDGWAVGLYTAPHEPCPEGRLVLNYPAALQQGYLALIADLDGRISGLEPANPAEEGKLHFWRAARRSLQGALTFAENYAREAGRLAVSEADPDRRAELLEMAAICRRVPAHPATTFREAVQSYWFTYLLGHMEGSHLGYSPGRLDQVLHPYYAADPDVVFDDAVEIFEELFVKMTRTEYIASLSWQGLGHGNLYQNCILGGEDREGNPADNETSLAILQAQVNVQMTQPTLSVWYTEGLSNAFLEKAAECVKTGVGYPAFFNLKTYVAHELRTSGLPVEVIRERAAIGGCTEPTLAGMSYGIVQAGFVNHGKLLELALTDGVDPATALRLFEPLEPRSCDDLERSYVDKMKVAVRNWQQYWNCAMAAHRDTVSLVFCSVFVDDCIARGRCMDDGGAVLNRTPTTLSSGLVNVANSLAAVRHLCDVERACSFDELVVAVREGWQGYDMLRKKAMAAPKWGNDDDRVDDIFLRLFDTYCSWVEGQDNYLGQPYDPSMLAISTPVPFGKVCGAFPDGRLPGEPLADGVTSPYPGTDTLGPTAVIRSSSKVDHTRIRGGLLNLKFHPTALAGTRGSRNLLALIKTYFDKPGFHVQFNVVDSQMLRDAQSHPERYRDLVVRVAGFSAYWVEMSKALQDQVIARTEHGL